MLAMMIGGMCASVQAELDGLFAQIDKQPVRTRRVSAQAFSKARKGFSWTVFTQANDHLLGLAQPLIDAHRWNGLRVVAADGSRLQVSTRVGAHLGADHYAFALFLPGAELTLHARLHPADGSERQMLFEALDAVRPDSDLLVLDRGLPGTTMVAILSQSRRHFCMRVDATGWTCVRQFLRSGHREAFVTLAEPSAADALTYEIDRAPTRVRLIRDVTPAGNVRCLMTSLLDTQRYPVAEFGALYHQRWRIEEAFKRIKHRLRLEAPTGLTHLAFQQDFAAKILADNLQRVLTAPTLPIDETTATHRTNRTYAMGALKPILAGCLLQLAHCLQSLPAALAAAARAICRVQRDRTYPRPQRTKPHLHLAYKFAC